MSVLTCEKWNICPKNRPLHLRTCVWKSQFHHLHSMFWISFRQSTFNYLEMLWTTILVTPVLFIFSTVGYFVPTFLVLLFLSTLVFNFHLTSRKIVSLAIADGSLAWTSLAWTHCHTRVAWKPLYVIMTPKSFLSWTYSWQKAVSPPPSFNQLSAYPGGRAFNKTFEKLLLFLGIPRTMLRLTLTTINCNCTDIYH